MTIGVLDRARRKNDDEALRQEKRRARVAQDARSRARPYPSTPIFGDPGTCRRSFHPDAFGHGKEASRLFFLFRSLRHPDGTSSRGSESFVFGRKLGHFLSDQGVDQYHPNIGGSVSPALDTGRSQGHGR